MTKPQGDEPDFEILEIIDLKDEDDAGLFHNSRADRAPGAPAGAPGASGPRAALGGIPRAVREDMRVQSARHLLRAVLPSLDALESCVRERPGPEALEQGVRVALRSLWDAFRPFELERIEGDGMPFDPRIHEASEITPSDRVPANTVLETLRVGYLLGGELVRPALVRVSTEASPGRV